MIDGGSTDGSVDIIRQYVDFISYWVSEPDKGIYNAMNKGLDRVTGDYVQFLNSGDSLVSFDVLEKVSIILENNPIDVLVGVTFWGGNERSPIIPPKEITGSFLFEHYLSHSASFVKSSLLRRIKFDESYKIISDWLFFVKALLLNNSSYASITLPITNYDIHGISSQYPWLCNDEREKAWKQIFGNLVYDDYVKYTSSKTALERIVTHKEHHKFLYTFLLIFSCPFYALYKLFGGRF